MDHHGGFYVGCYKAYQKLILWGYLLPISIEDSAKYQLWESLVEASVTVRLGLVFAIVDHTKWVKKAL
jgi:hypothetical protein